MKRNILMQNMFRIFFPFVTRKKVGAHYPFYIYIFVIKKMKTKKLWSLLQGKSLPEKGTGEREIELMCENRPNTNSRSIFETWFPEKPKLQHKSCVNTFELINRLPFGIVSRENCDLSRIQTDHIKTLTAYYDFRTKHLFLSRSVVFFFKFFASNLLNYKHVFPRRVRVFRVRVCIVRRN